MPQADGIGVQGVLTATIECEYPDRLEVTADEVEQRDGLIVVTHRNAYVTTGLDTLMKRYGNIATVPAAPGFIGVSSSSSAVTAATVNLNGASGGTAANTIIKAFSPALSYASPTLTAGATFVNADFTSGVFIINKIGWLNTSTDAGTGLQDVIGGTGGSAPYTKTFTLDLTNVGTFTLVPQVAVSAVAV